MFSLDCCDKTTILRGSVPNDDSSQAEPEKTTILMLDSLLNNTCALSLGNKKERQGSEVLTLMLQALQSIIASESLPADRVLVRLCRKL